jgi:diguanylate cyclase (GGDEF)-like protein
MSAMSDRTPVQETYCLPTPRILIVDDVPANLVAMRRLLGKMGAELVMVESGNAALAACLDQEFALILLDVQMPEMDGFEVAEILSSEEATRDTPIIFVTAAFSDDFNRLKGYRSGAVDYIAKPINDLILRSKVQVFLDLYRSRLELKQALAALHDQNHQLNQEVAERMRLEALARHQASHDALTGLPNRRAFMEQLGQAVARDEPFTLMYVDIDGFKPVNDTHGHAAGDALLKAIAGRLGRGIRDSDTAARLGGDEFALLLRGMGAGEALELGSKLCASLAQPYNIRVEAAGEVAIRVGASIGAALFPQHGQDAEGLIHAADEAMYRAKKGGKNQCLLAAGA